MDDYYPHHTGTGEFGHPRTAGPFVTATHAGSNVQIVATIAPLCPSASYSLRQWVTYTKAIFDGRHDPREGTTTDDIKASRQDESTFPFRQQWASPAGAVISMADGPGVEYTQVNTAEVDRQFTTMLEGPAGAKAVFWSTSVQVAGKRVVKNTIT